MIVKESEQIWVLENEKFNKEHQSFDKTISEHQVDGDSQ